ncbi:MAG: hypothetical protein ISR95_02525 [Candidatus Marinimicrobia bacterium]|nr:hypothetical protein [Candidatus Neomarinimicrobiota bacterium]
MKMIKTWVNRHLLKLDHMFKEHPFSEINVKVQNGIPVDAKKIKEFQKPKNKA